MQFFFYKITSKLQQKQVQKAKYNHMFGVKNFYNGISLFDHRIKTFLFQITLGRNLINLF